ncbi:MAG: SET domain-containing protein-lysine N-methyltransferase [Flavobacterium sp.]|nr:SET domain-containing protein-lysine N-methyltransferase [Flavobacterium sp.]
MAKKHKIKMSWVNSNLKKGKSTTKGGRGVFAKNKIKKGEILVVYGGYVMTIKEFETLPEELKEFSYHISDDLLFGPIRKEDVGMGEYFNHSCHPNAGFRDVITLVAIKNISKDEEVTFDYATCMTSEILKIECGCGKKNCRKKITGNDWKKPELHKKYEGYFQPYIQKKIDKIKKLKKWKQFFALGGQQNI